MLKLTLFHLLIFVLPILAVGQANSYVGYRYKAVIPDTVLPNGVKSLGGGLVGGIENKPVWGVSQVSRGRTRMLWLEKAAAEDAGGVTMWEVRDVLSFPSFAADHDLLFGVGPMECTVNGRADEDIVVHVQFLRRQRAYKTIKAWRANVTKERFEPLNSANVKCVYDEP